MSDFKNYNPPTVVVVMIPAYNNWEDTGLVIIKRGLADGHGKWALPGGYQEMGETWQQTAVREVMEETGIDIAGLPLKVFDAVTVADGKMNLLFVEVLGSIGARSINFTPNDEVLAVAIIQDTIETAFPAHTKAIDDWFIRTSGAKRKQCPHKDASYHIPSTQYKFCTGCNAEIDACGWVIDAS